MRTGLTTSLNRRKEKGKTIRWRKLSTHNDYFLNNNKKKTAVKVGTRIKLRPDSAGYLTLQCDKVTYVFYKLSEKKDWPSLPMLFKKYVIHYLLYKEWGI